MHESLEPRLDEIRGASFGPLEKDMQEAVDLILQDFVKNPAGQLETTGMNPRQILMGEGPEKMRALLVRFIENIQAVSTNNISSQEVARGLISGYSGSRSQILKAFTESMNAGVLDKLQRPAPTGNAISDEQNMREWRQRPEVQNFATAVRGFLE